MPKSGRGRPTPIPGPTQNFYKNWAVCKGRFFIAGKALGPRFRGVY